MCPSISFPPPAARLVGFGPDFLPRRAGTAEYPPSRSNDDVMALKKQMYDDR